MRKTVIHRPLWHYTLLLAAAISVIIVLFGLFISLILDAISVSYKITHFFLIGLISFLCIFALLIRFLYKRYVAVTPSAQFAYEWDDGPWLVYGKDPKTQLRVCWFTKKTEKTGFEFGKNKDDLIEITDDTENPVKMHVVELDNLEPNTRYIYRIKTKTGTDTFHNFKTGPNSFKHVSFVLIGDTQNGGGYGTDNWGFEPIAEQLKKEQFDFIAHTGDVSDQGNDIKSWHQFFKSAAPLSKYYAIEIAVGNHDTGTQFLHDESIKKYPDEGANFDYFFPYPFDRDDSEDRITPFSSRHYYFDYSFCRFIFVDTQNSKMAEPKSRQWRFLDETLKSCPDNYWKIIITHRTLLELKQIDIGNYILRMSKYGRFLVPIFDRFGVDLVVSGHAHNYQHMERKLKEKNLRTTYLVSGGAGNELRKNPPKNLEDINVPEFIYFENSTHYMKFEIEENQTIITAKYPNGDVLDSFKITRNDRSL